METTRDPRGVPTGDGAGGRTPHSKPQLEMTSDSFNTVPSKPRRHEYKYVRLPNAVPAVVHCWPQRKGREYIDIFTIHTATGSPTMTEDQLDAWWEHCMEWHPSGEVHAALDAAKQNGRFQDVLRRYTEADEEVVSHG